MHPAVKSALPYALLMALLLLGVFMFRSMYQPFYLLTGRYALAVLAVTVGTLSLYCRTLQPVRVRGEGSMNWFLGRAWLMGLLGSLLAALLVYGYAYQVDDDYFTRRIGWERQELEKTSMPQEIVEVFLEDEYKAQPFHYEELTIGCFALFATGLGAIVVCMFFAGYNKRDLKTFAPA